MRVMRISFSNFEGNDGLPKLLVMSKVSSLMSLLGFLLKILH